MRRCRRCRRIVAMMMALVMIVMSVDVNELLAYGAEIQSTTTQSVESEDVSADESLKDVRVELPDSQEMERPNGYVDSGYVAPSVSGHENVEEILMATELPDRYSAVEAGHVTSVKDQQSWGTCWAFATVAAMESYALSHNLVASPEDVDFSEYALAYLTYDDTMYMEQTGDYTRLNAANQGFNSGGNYVYTYKTLTKWAGIYNDDGTSYDFSVIYKQFNSEFYSDDIDFVLTGQQYINMNDTEEVKSAIVENGAVAVSYYSTDKYADVDYNYFYNYEIKSTNHAVAIVGWDDNLDKNLFTVKDSEGVSHTPNNNGGWLVKNSWGTDSGIDGYFWLSYEDFGVNLNNAVVYQIAPKDMYDNIYQHDGATIFWGGVYSRAFATIYEIKGENKQKLQAISFGIDDVCRKYVINVYRNTDAAILENGELVASVSGSTKFAGYYTVTLPEPIECSEGDSFSIVISFDESTFIIAGHKSLSVVNGGAYMISSSQTGQAYYGQPGHLVDMYEHENYYVDLSIKAFTTDVEDVPETPQISNIEYISGEQLTITWQKMDGATSYELWKSTSADGADAKLIVGITDNTYVDVSDSNSVNAVDWIKPGETYYYKVRAMYEDGVSEYSLVKSIDTLPPVVRINRSITKDNSSVVLTWNTSDVSYDGFKLYRAKGDTDYEMIATLAGDVTSYTDKDIKYAVVNSYYVTGYINESGVAVESRKSNYVEGGKRLDNPSGMSASSSYYGEVNISWEAPYYAVDGYNVYVENYGEYELIASVGSDIKSYVYNMTDFIGGNAYNFRVNCYILEDGNMYESYPLEKSVVMGSKPTESNFKWYVKKNENSTSTMLKLYNPTYSTYAILNKSGNSSSYTVSGNVGEWAYSDCAVGETDTIRYKDYNSSLEAWSNPATSIGGAYMEPVLQPLEDVNVPSLDAGVTLEAVITNEMKNFDYRYQWYVSDTADGVATAIEGATGSSYYAQVSPFDEKYYYCVITCEYGDITTFSTANGSGGRTKVAGSKTVGIPQLNGVEYVSDGNVSITWDSVPYVTDYELWKCVGDSEEYVLVASHLTETNYLDTIEPYKANYYKVRAVYNGVYSEYSNVKGTYIPLPLVEIGRGSDATVAKITWDKLADVTGYRVYRSDGTDTVLLDTLNYNVTEYTDTTAKALTTYSYYVCTYMDTVDLCAESEKSNVVTVYFNLPQISELAMFAFVDVHFLGWDKTAYNYNLVDGYNIYIMGSGWVKIKIATVDNNTCIYKYDVTDYEQDENIFYGVAPYVIVDGVETEGELAYGVRAVEHNIPDRETRWFVKENASGQLVIAVKITDDISTRYYIEYDTNPNDHKLHDNIIEIYESNANMGYELPLNVFKPEEVSHVFISAMNDRVTKYPGEVVGGPFVSPILKAVENEQVSSAEDSVVLKAIITNPMENFDYRYQWYVSDSATGEATAIDGATESTYTVTGINDEVKYYYCSVICEYGDIITINTSNINGERTMVSGSTSSLVVTLPDEEGYSITSNNDRVLVSGGSFSFTLSIEEGYSVTSDFAVKANGIVLEPDAKGAYTINNITENVTITIEGVADITSPVITGVSNGEIYYKEVVFTVSDVNPISVTVDGVIIEPVDGSYTILADNKEYTIVAVDEAGNRTEITIGVYKVYTVTFKVDGVEIAQKHVNYGATLNDIPTIPAKTGYDQVAPYWDVSDFSNITFDVMVNAVYTINKYTVTLNSTKGYHFDKDQVSVNYGENFSVSVIIDDGYSATDSYAVKANGVILVADAEGVYTIKCITKNVIITVEGVADITAPVLTGIEDGKIYYREITFEVSDANLSKITVDGEVIGITNGSYTIVADNSAHTIVAEDESGNKTEIEIGVYKMYTVIFFVDGVEIARREVKHYQSLDDSDIPAIPSKTGYDNLPPYWDVTDFSNITSDMEVNAVYRLNWYIVDFSWDNGYTTSKGGSVVNYGEDFSFKVYITQEYSATSDFAVKANGEILVADAEGVYTINYITEPVTITVEGIVDVKAPVITGLSDGGKYYEDVTFTVKDVNLSNVTVDGEVIEPVNGLYTIATDNKEHTIVAKDSFGNEASITIGLYGVYTVTFMADGVEVAKFEVNYGQGLADSDIPEIPVMGFYDQTAPYWDVSDFSNITSNVEVNAVYTLNKYTVTFNSAEGYHFDQDEITVNCFENLRFKVIIDEGYSATDNFEVLAHNLILRADAEGMYTINCIMENLTVTVRGVEDITSPVITGVADNGIYYGKATFAVSDVNLSKVTVDGVVVSPTDGYYTIVADNREHTIVAVDESGNRTEVVIGVYKVYTVTFLADGVEVAKKCVNYGETLTDIPTVPAKTGYDQTSPYWDVTDFSNITSDMEVNAVYTINKYTVTLSSGTGYSFDKTETTVTYGESFSFSVSVAEGYTVTESFAVKANGVALVADDDGVYTVTDISADTTVTVEGVADVTAPVITGITDGAVYYTTRYFEVVESNAVVVTVNGEAVTDYILSGDVDMTYTIEVADEAGNAVTVTVTMKSIDNITTAISNLDESNVKLDDEAAIIAVKQTAEGVDTTYATDAEKAKLNTIISKCDGLSGKINDILVAVDTVSEVINALPEATQTETDSEEAVTVLKEAKEAYEALSDYEKSLVSADYMAKLKALEDKLSDYKFFEGAGSTYTKGDTGLVFKVNGAYSKFTTIKIDNVEPGADNYTVEAGSTIVTLKAEYLEALADGEHKLTVVYEDGETTTTFSIEASVMYGDANGDGIIHISDAVILKQALAGMNVSLDESASDVSCDGVVDIKDAVMVMQYLAGMDVVLGEGR